MNRHEVSTAAAVCMPKADTVKSNSVVSRLKLSGIGKVMAGAMVLCLSQGASAYEVEPYFHSWGGSLHTAKQNAGMTSAMLAFAVTRGSCVMDVGFLEKLPEARSYVASGGKLTLSFGGAAGTFAEIACKDDNQLFSMIERVMNEAGTRRLDFDVEGHQLLNAEGNARRARVLARLKAKYPDMYISISLPGWLQGFSADSMNLLRTTMSAGVKIDRIVAMSQSFGLENIRTMVSPSTVGQATIMTFRAAATQVQSLYPYMSQDQVHAMMGITPMIGKNDDGSVFTLDDAQTVANFAKNNGVGMISYWSFQRDRAQANNSSWDLNSYSGVAQSDFQYHAIFKAAVGGYVAPTTPVTNPSTSCNADNWVMGKQYRVGNVVTYANAKYIARVANPGYNPTISTYFWNRYVC